MPTREISARTRRRWAVAATAVVVTAAVLRVAVDPGATSAAAASAAATTSPAAPVSTHVSPSIRGTIATASGTSFTVDSDTGQTVTVLLGAGTAFGTARNPVDPADVLPGTHVAVVGDLQGSTLHADRVLVRADEAPAPAASVPVPTAPASPPPVAVAARCGVELDEQAAVGVAAADGLRAGVAVLDTATGAYTAAGDADGTFNTASVVKVLIATQLLLTGQMQGSVAATARQMITESDDDDADALYGLVGSDDVLPTIAAHYAITDLGSPPAETGQWGETRVTPDGLAHLDAALHSDPVVWPWLSSAMAATTATAADGTDQMFGIPSAARSWSVKQGWMVGLGPGATYDTTGYVDGDRFVVVLLTAGDADQYGSEMAGVLTRAAQALMPDGAAPGSAC